MKTATIAAIGVAAASATIGLAGPAHADANSFQSPTGNIIWCQAYSTTGAAGSRVCGGSPHQRRAGRIVGFDSWVVVRIPCTRIMLRLNSIGRRVGLTAADKVQVAARRWAMLVA
ncbi:MAG: hypothetical protein WB777_15260 [Mycobacterium sp.]